VELSQTQRDDLERAVRTYQGHVLEAREYLENRGIDGPIAGHARLGVVRDPMPGHEDYLGRLAIPFLTPAGPVDIRFRCITNHGTDDLGAERSCKDAGHSKYLNLPGKSPRMFNAQALMSDVATVAVCEGELDALIVHHHVQVPAVGIPGAQVWNGQKHYPRMFRPFSRVLVFADGDDAGRDLGKQIAKDLNDTTTVQIVRLEQGMDATDTFLLEGAEGLRARAGLT
jgi:5S rRNA maturation endonuclease (ribonuclease M5)